MLRRYGGLSVSCILEQEDLKPSKGEIEKVGLVSLKEFVQKENKLKFKQWC